MRKNSVLFIFVILLPLLTLSQARGGDIYGSIIGEDGSKLQGVLVILTGGKVGTRETLSAEDGTFRFEGLPHGEYSLNFEKRGFKSFSRSSIEVRPEQAYHFAVNMHSGLINVEITTAGKPVDRDNRYRLPLREQIEEITGIWQGSNGLTYEIIRRENHLTWMVHGNDERGEITLDHDQMRSEWHGSRGDGSATGKVIRQGNRGKPEKIKWSNGVIFTRIYKMASPKGFSKVETIVPPSDIDSAPFDSAVLTNGNTLVSGPKGKLLALVTDRKGTLKPTEYPFNGRYFESDKYDRMWYWNCPRGTLYLYDPGSSRKLQEQDNPGIKFTLKQFIAKTYANGTLAVDPDGSQVFVGWWKNPQGTCRVYRFDTGTKKLQKIYEGNGYAEKVHALEVTNSSEIFMARSHDILQYKIREGWIKHIKLPQGHRVNHDSLTSDLEGNLYYASAGDQKGIFLIPSERGEIRTLTSLKQMIEVPSGLTWNAKRNYLTAARKQKGELIKIFDNNSRQWEIKVLNQATGLVRPIAIEEGPGSSIFVNGDEVGVLKVSKSGKVSIFKNEICSFQPPAADFTFRQGLLFYSWAAPGFTSQIVTIPDSKSYSEYAKNIGTPAGIDLGPKNTIYFCNYSNKGAVYRLDGKGSTTEIISNIPYPLGLVVDGNNHFWVGAAEPNAKPVASAMNEVLSTRLLHYDSQGKFIKEVINFNLGKYKGQNYKFTFFDVDNAGKNIYLPSKNMILRLDQTGKVLNTHKGNYMFLRGAKLFSDGYLYFVDYWASALYRIKM